MQALEKMGHTITQEEMNKIMKEHDIAGDGVISIQEFRLIFFDVCDQKHEEAK